MTVTRSAPTCFDVAAYILNKIGQTTTWKLQKLCYYTQAWSLVWDEKPIFADRIEAWANGPVIPDLYAKHRGTFYIDSIEGNVEHLSKSQRETVDAVIKTYGDKSSNWLIELTHTESPWLNARRREGLGPGERGEAEITLDDMAEYYGGLCAETKG